jgi:hypothetical protein
MTHINSLQRELLKRVGEEVQHYGFSLRSGREFMRQFPGGRTSFGLHFIKHENDVDITAHIAIRFDDVEELVNAGDQLLSNAEKRDTYTLGAELGNISGVGQKRWTIVSEEDLGAVADDIVRMFVDVAVPYADEFEDRQRTLQVLSGDGPESWLHNPFHSARAMRAVAMSMLIEGEEAAKSCASAKMAFMRARQEPDTAFFEAFVERVGVGG